MAGTWCTDPLLDHQYQAALVPILPKGRSDLKNIALCKEISLHVFATYSNHNRIAIDTYFTFSNILNFRL